MDPNKIEPNTEAIQRDLDQEEMVKVKIAGRLESHRDRMMMLVTTPNGTEDLVGFQQRTGFRGEFSPPMSDPKFKTLIFDVENNLGPEEILKKYEFPKFELKDYQKDFLKLISEAESASGPKAQLATGLPLSGGFKRGELVLFAARRNVEKKSMFGMTPLIDTALELSPESIRYQPQSSGALLSSKHLSNPRSKKLLEEIRDDIIRLVLHPDRNSIEADGVTFTTTSRRTQDVHITVNKNTGVVTVDPPVFFTLTSEFRSKARNKKIQKQIRPPSQHYLNLRKGKW